MQNPERYEGSTEPRDLLNHLETCRISSKERVLMRALRSSKSRGN